MLKIKKDVDLNILEKFGFNYLPTREKYQYSHPYYDSFIDIYENRDIVFYGNVDDEDFITDKLYELISENLVELSKDEHTCNYTYGEVEYKQDEIIEDLKMIIDANERGKNNFCKKFKCCTLHQVEEKYKKLEKENKVFKRALELAVVDMTHTNDEYKRHIKEQYYLLNAEKEIEDENT